LRIVWDFFVISGVSVAALSSCDGATRLMGGWAVAGCLVRKGEAGVVPGYAWGGVR